MTRSPAATSVFLLAILAAACAAPGDSTAPGEAQGEKAVKQARLSQKEIADSVVSAMDTAADPCQDFYRYTCGSWLDRTEIPGDKPRWGRFNEVAERNRTVLREILDEAASNPGDDPDQARIGNFYVACMDEEAVERAGTAPLEPLLERVSGVKDVESFMAAAGALHKNGIGAAFSAQVQPDLTDPTMDIAHFGQGGLGLPDRDYYLRDDEEGQGILADYQAHVARMLEFLGTPADKAAGDAKAILAFETELAKVSLPRQELRDPEKTYHKLDIGGLKELTPEFPWDAYLQATGYPDVKEINVEVPAFFEGLQPLLEKTDADLMQAYLRWHLIDGTAALLNRDIVDADFAFFNKRLRGQQELEARWKRCVRATDGALGEALAQAFVDRQFAGESKEMALEMIRDVEDAFQENLPSLTWMDATTQERAVDKMSAIVNKIGYPDKWRDYSSLTMKPEAHFENTLAAREFEFHRNFRKIGNKVDKGEWFMTPPTVNAGYIPPFNEMIFPAGIMQSPFFHRDFPAVMNYGGIGMAMGHELTHGFDDQGRKFDKEGRLTQWWEDEVIEKFEGAAACVRDLYDGFEFQPGLTLNGQLTLGENIADLGGVKQAYEGYKRWEARHGAPEPLVDSLTNDQLFFVRIGQIWCTLATPEFEKLQATTDPHSLPKFRVNGPLANYSAFAEAFQCAEGTPMNPVESCQVW
jgi:predicted metalloendopeptidase